MAATLSLRGLVFVVVSLYHVCDAMSVDEICEHRCLYGRGGILCNCNAMHFAGKRSETGESVYSPPALGTNRGRLTDSSDLASDEGTRQQLTGGHFNPDTTREIIMGLLRAARPKTSSVPSQWDRSDIKDIVDDLRTTAADLSESLVNNANRDDSTDVTRHVGTEARSNSALPSAHGELNKFLEIVLAKHRPQSLLKKRSVDSKDEQLTVDSGDQLHNIERFFDNAVHLRHP